LRPAALCAGRPVLVLALALATACSPTVDSLGYNGANGPPLKPLSGPSAGYPSPFRDLLGKSDAEINAKIAATFAQLFHGDPGNQAIYVPIGADQAKIQDYFHGDVRTEGIGYGMLIAVELDKRDELDRLWTYARTTLQVTTGPGAGYFSSFCDFDTVIQPCLDPFGLQQMLMALIFAHDRYTRAGAAATLDYEGDAKQLLTVMRHKQDENGGIVNNVTDTFDADTQLAFDVPDHSAAGVGRPSIEMPPYYDLWAQATSDPFWTQAGAAGRAYWKRAAGRQTTGLFPVRATFAGGVPVAGSDDFEAECYRAQLSMVLDRIWFDGARDPWTVDENNRLLAFFTSVGITTYGGQYSIDGSMTLMASHDAALVAMNGVSATTATSANRMAFVDAVWNLPTPVGPIRYFSGLMDLLALLTLGGQLRVW